MERGFNEVVLTVGPVGRKKRDKIYQLPESDKRQRRRYDTT